MPFTPTVQAFPSPGLSIQCQFSQRRDVVFDLGIDAATVGFFKLIRLPLPMWQGGTPCVPGRAEVEQFFKIGGKKGLFRVRERFSPMPANVAVSQRVDYMIFYRRKTIGSVPEEWLDPELMEAVPYFAATIQNPSSGVGTPAVVGAGFGVAAATAAWGRVAVRR